MDKKQYQYNFFLGNRADNCPISFAALSTWFLIREDPDSTGKTNADPKP